MSPFQNPSTMKSTIFYLVVVLLFNHSYKPQTQTSRIEVVQPTIENEATSVWRTINDISFFEEHGYQVNLPKDPLIDTLVTKSRNGTFGNEDFSAIRTLLETNVFQEKDYLLAIQKVTNQTDFLNELINEIDIKKGNWDWNFKMFKTYKVVLTLYGSGGSYDPNDGIITLLTNKTGGFMKYKNPAYTIIHEITHMGMEDSIVRRYHLPHGLKERLVDTFVSLMFQEKLPGYKMQTMGDERIDKYLTTESDIRTLDKILSNFLGE